MTDGLALLAEQISPESTVLFLGAGSSLPSHAPSSSKIIAHLSREFNQPSADLTLPEMVELLQEKTKDRKRIISAVRALFVNLTPAGGLRNLPLYDWKSLYTTNYDELIEDAYRVKGQPLNVYSSNFDFTSHPRATKLFKLHGTISKDVADGSNSRLILSQSDSSLTADYREHLYDTFKTDLWEAHLVIIGHSLADVDIKEIIDHVLRLNKETLSGNRVILLMHTEDQNRALIYQARGIRVVFGGVDDFFAALALKTPPRIIATSSTDDPIEAYPALRATTVDVGYELTHGAADVSRMFNGWPSTYADIVAGMTFDRSIVARVEEFIKAPNSVCATILGASGVGKTTASRQLLVKLHRSGLVCYEHIPPFQFRLRPPNRT